MKTSNTLLDLAVAKICFALVLRFLSVIVDHGVILNLFFHMTSCLRLEFYYRMKVVWRRHDFFFLHSFLPEFVIIYVLDLWCGWQPFGNRDILCYGAGIRLSVNFFFCG